MEMCKRLPERSTKQTCARTPPDWPCWTAVGPPTHRAGGDSAGGADGALCLTLLARGTHGLTAVLFGTLLGRSHAAPGLTSNTEPFLRSGCVDADRHRGVLQQHLARWP